MVLLCDLRNSERSILHNQSACKSLTLWGMKKAESPRRVRRRARLVLLLSECGGAAQVARETGTPKTYISAIVNGTRGLGDKLAAKFEHEYDKPEGWFDLSVDHAEAVQAPVVDAPSDQSLSSLWPYEHFSPEQYRKFLTPEERKENEALLWGKIMMAEKKNGTDGP